MMSSTIFNNLKISNSCIKQNIALIGLPYSGKSYLSKFLSLKNFMYLVETDKQIENIYNLKLQNIIDNYGELEFINIENEVIRELDCKNTVISTGGSIIYNPDNLYHLKDNLNTTIIHLHLDQDEFKNRIVDIESRGVINPYNHNIRDFYNYRLNLYNNHADIILDANNKKEVLKNILNMKV
jgi:shikimate kinase